MTQRGSIEVIDKGGWRKVFPLNKNILYIGTDLRNDIAIEPTRGSGLAPRHLQMVPSPTSSLGYRLINMGPIEILLGQNGERSLPPRSALDIADGDIVRLGDFTFVFHGAVNRTSDGSPAVTVGAASAAAAAAGAAVARKGNPIGLNVMLSHTQLTPEQAIEGAISIKNLGDKTGVQFKIEVDGFEPESYDVGPAPILFPDVEKKVPFRLRHPQRANPPAGDRRLTIRVTAPAAYPGEVATASQVIRVTPYIKHSLSLKMSS
jgi:hypothetical protein